MPTHRRCASSRATKSSPRPAMPPRCVHAHRQKFLQTLDLTKVNPQTGPFYVEGAEPGDTLVVHLLKVAPNRDWGWGDRFRISLACWRRSTRPWRSPNPRRKSCGYGT
ncbi:MAG: acetamidase/formamidase family protein [Gammaproteobacteria bacterium]